MFGDRQNATLLISKSLSGCVVYSCDCAAVRQFSVVFVSSRSADLSTCAAIKPTSGHMFPVSLREWLVGDSLHYWFSLLDGFLQLSWYSTVRERTFVKHFCSGVKPVPLFWPANENLRRRTRNLNIIFLISEHYLVLHKLRWDMLGRKCYVLVLVRVLVFTPK